MDYSINERSQQVALDDLSSAKKGEISKWNRELKKFKIGDFRPTTLKWESPTSKEVDHKNQHNQIIRQRMDYKKNTLLKEKRGIR